MSTTTRPDLGAQLNLRMAMIPEHMENRSGRLIAPTHITIHNTSNTNAGADAAAHARMVTKKGHYMHKGKPRFVSWHFTVDDKETVKHLPVNERAIHAGKGNANSIAIEICMNEGIDQGAANLRAQMLVAVLMHDLKIPSSNVVPHKHWTGKNCPSLLIENFEIFCFECATICESIEANLSEGMEESPDDVLSKQEISDALNPGAEAEAELNAEPEEDLAEEHDLVAAEVEAFVE